MTKGEIFEVTRPSNSRDDKTTIIARKWFVNHKQITSGNQHGGKEFSLNRIPFFRRRFNKKNFWNYRFRQIICEWYRSVFHDVFFFTHNYQMLQGMQRTSFLVNCGATLTSSRHVVAQILRSESRRDAWRLSWSSLLLRSGRDVAKIVKSDNFGNKKFHDSHEYAHISVLPSLR